MVTIKCQYTGIEFEAATKRAKNHPVVSQMLSDAHRAGNYGAVLAALESGKNAGLATIETVVAHVDAELAKKAELDKKRAEKAAKAEAEAKRIREERVAARDAAIVGMTEVECFDFSEFEKVFESTNSLDGGGKIVDRVFTGTVSGARAAVIYHFFGGHDYDETIRYYCADPKAAGLDVTNKKSTTLDDFFG